MNNLILASFLNEMNKLAAPMPTAAVAGLRRLFPQEAAQAVGGKLLHTPAPMTISRNLSNIQHQVPGSITTAATRVAPKMPWWKRPVKLPERVSTGMKESMPTLSAWVPKFAKGVGNTAKNVAGTVVVGGTAIGAGGMYGAAQNPNPLPMY